MDYQTYQPSEELNPLVKCFWTLENHDEDSSGKQTVVPDGCIEMIFHYGDLFKQYLDKESYIIQPRCFVIGQLTRPLEIEPTGKTGVFSVRFYPQGFLPFATVPIKELENTAISIEQLYGKDGKDLADEILKTQSITERINLVESFFITRLINQKTKEGIVKSIVTTIMTANGQIPIETLSQKHQITRRQLERKFISTIGLSPKQLSKTVRLQTMLKSLLNNDYSSLTALAYEGKYYDQAHFIKDFREFTGFTPKDFYTDEFKMSSRFYGKE